MKAKLIDVDDNGVYYQSLAFVCPGCALRENGRWSGLHMIPVNTDKKSPSWDWNGDLEKPTLSPSILTNGHSSFVCHSFLTDGVFNFLTDSTHPLSGQQIPIPDLPDWFFEGR